jgi:hypothetical protein
VSTSLVRTEGTAVVAWSQELEGAKMLMRSGLLPKSITSPEAALFIILTGRDLGLSPVQSLRSINVIQGKIEVAADAQLGLFHRAGGKSHWRTLTNEVAVLELHAPWLTEPHAESFTLEDARRAGLGGDNWRKYPKAMLRSRAITAGLKSVGFDPTAGMYAEGEIGGPEPVLEPAAVVSVASDTSLPLHTGIPDARPERVNVQPPPVRTSSDGYVDLTTGEVTEPATVSAPVPAPADPVPSAYAPSERQVKYLNDMMASAVFSDDERARVAEWLATKATRQTMKDTIDWAKRTLDQRKSEQAEGAAT